jgi:hypothetical protein
MEAATDDKGIVKGRFGRRSAIGELGGQTIAGDLDDPRVMLGNGWTNSSRHRARPRQVPRRPLFISRITFAF